MILTKLDIRYGVEMVLTSETAVLWTVPTVTNAQSHIASHFIVSVMGILTAYMEKMKFDVTTFHAKGYCGAWEPTDVSILNISATGINHCPTGDDETSCDMISCPNNCSCFSSSIICFPDIAIIPIMPTTNIKHLSITYSHIPIPNRLTFLNLSRNHTQNICFSLQIECNFYEKLIHLDISNNEITFLWSNCFKRLQALKLASLEKNPYTHSEVMRCPSLQCHSSTFDIPL